MLGFSQRLVEVSWSSPFFYFFLRKQKRNNFSVSIERQFFHQLAFSSAC